MKLSFGAEKLWNFSINLNTHHITSIAKIKYITWNIDREIYSLLAAVLIASPTGTFSKALSAPNMAIDGTTEVIFCSADF